LTRRIVKQVISPDCLGQMHRYYARYCSEGCPVSALCVLLVMGEYLRRESSHSPSDQPTEALDLLPTPSDEV